MEKRNIYYIKMGAGINREEVCGRYLTGNPESDGIFLGWNEAREEQIRQSIGNELAMRSKCGDKELSNDEIRECWNPVLSDLGRVIMNDGVRTRAMNNIRDVCMATENDIFFTFHDGRMWWCHPLGEAGKNVLFNEPLYRAQLEELGRKLNAKIRMSDLIRRSDGWKDSRISGELLEERSISGRLTRKQMIQGTMARLHDKNEDLSGAPSDKSLFLWTIGLEKDREFAKFNITLDALRKMIEKAITRLNPTDFENFVDMILVKNGWLRVGGIGKNIKSIDGEYIKPITGEHVFVQVKACLSKAELLDAAPALYEISGINDRTSISYIIFHTLSGIPEGGIKSTLLDDAGSDEAYMEWIERLMILDGEALSELSIQSDIIDWLRKTAFPFI